MSGYQTVDEVISHYMNFAPTRNEKREELIQSYYRNKIRTADPCWKTVLSDHYRIVDHCDIFVNASKEGTVLALYSSIKTLKTEQAVLKIKYPLQQLDANIFNYYGLKLNILAALSNYNISKLVLYYDENKSQVFFQKEILATMVLDHYHIHYQPKIEESTTQKPQDVLMEKINLELF